MVPDGRRFGGADPPAASADLCELIRIRTEVTLHLRDERFSDSHDVEDAFEACIVAIRQRFGRRCDLDLQLLMSRWLEKYWERERAARSGSDRLVSCPDCSGLFTPRGLERHQRARRRAES